LTKKTAKGSTAYGHRRLLSAAGPLAAALLLAAILLTGCEQGRKKVTLRFKYQPGLHLVYDLNQKANHRRLEGDSVVSRGSSEIQMVIEETVRRMVDDSTAEILEFSEWTSTWSKEGDSATSDTNLDSREMILYVKPNGKVIDIEFVSKTPEASIDYLENYYEQGFPVFPAGEHSQGYSWTQTTKVLLEEEPVEASTTYKIESFAREQGYDCVVISYDGNLVIPVKPGPDDSLETRGVNRIQITGMMYFAHKEGITVSNRDRWVIDSHGERMHEGKRKEYRTIYEGDSNLTLKEHKRTTP
jgi:hypothetical protein